MPRPNPPVAGTVEYERWCKDASISWEGGYLKAAYGNIAQTWDVNKIIPSTGKDVTSKRKEHDRYNQIGGAKKRIGEKTFTVTRYPKVNSSPNAGGDPITIVTPVGQYTARLGGDIQSFVKWILDRDDEIYDNFSFYSSHGADYGPYVKKVDPTDIIP
tara:strand:+ start:227 stop:700 length:474 start_codon:yes stop_codon:yes gene_type:complete